LKLYEFSTTRSIRCRWLLQEIGVPFEPIEVDLTKGDQLKPEYLEINPFGKVPALVDGNVKLFDSGAICTYLADKYSHGNLIPQTGSDERAMHDQWSFFCMDDLEQPLWMIAKHTFIYDEKKCSQDAIALACEDFREIVKPLEHYMKDRKFIVGDKFQMVDVLIGQTLFWAFASGINQKYNLLEGCPSLISYLRRLSERENMPSKLRETLLSRLAAL
jgi:glutathione S-transferase